MTCCEPVQDESDKQPDQRHNSSENSNETSQSNDVRIDLPTVLEQSVRLEAQRSFSSGFPSPYRQDSPPPCYTTVVSEAPSIQRFEYFAEVQRLRVPSETSQFSQSLEFDSPPPSYDNLSITQKVNE